jgi:hypothetical protein
VASWWFPVVGLFTLRRQAPWSCWRAVRTEQNGIMISMRRSGPSLGDLLIDVPVRGKDDHAFLDPGGRNMISHLLNNFTRFLHNSFSYLVLYLPLLDVTCYTC